MELDTTGSIVKHMTMQQIRRRLPEMIRGVGKIMWHRHLRLILYRPIGRRVRQRRSQQQQAMQPVV